MQRSRENEKTKQTAPKAEVKKTSRSKAQDSLPQPISKGPKSGLRAEPTGSSMGPVLTQEEFRARVARKAFELYENRRALTEVDDWVEAERLVKLQLLSEQRGASV